MRNAYRILLTNHKGKRHLRKPRIKMVDDLKLSPCSAYFILSFGWFPGFWTIYDDVSGHSVCSIFIGGVRRKNNLIPVILPAYTAYEDRTECSETSAYIIQTPTNYPKENIIYSEHGESLKSIHFEPLVIKVTCHATVDCHIRVHISALPLLVSTWWMCELSEVGRTPPDLHDLASFLTK